MKNSNRKTISDIWKGIEAESKQSGSMGRTYRRLDLDRENGLRLSCIGPDCAWELMIETDKATEGPGLKFPSWKGMVFDYLSLNIPVADTGHIILRLESNEHRDVFVTVCEDLAAQLENITDAGQRNTALGDFLERWSRFFDRFSMRGLTPERQRGLFGELWYLRHLMDNGLDCAQALDAWKGWEPGIHDFEKDGHALEVKTTLTKEPRKVRIGSERQLDETGLVSLHLLILSLSQAEAGGESLPQIIKSMRRGFRCHRSCLMGFEHALREAGYLDVHDRLYDKSFTIRKKELFKVEEGFPRIITIPQGTGDLRYSLLVATCEPWASPEGEYLLLLRGDEQ